MGGRTTTTQVTPYIPGQTIDERALLTTLMREVGGMTYNPDKWDGRVDEYGVKGGWEQPEGGWESPYQEKYTDQILGAYDDSQGYQKAADAAVRKALGYSDSAAGYFKKAGSYDRKFDALAGEFSSLAAEIARTQNMSEKELSEMTQMMVDNADLLLPIIEQELPALQRGELPEAYKNNFQDYMGSTIDTAMGSVINDLAKRGVIGSSVLDRQVGLTDKAIADASAQNFQSNIGLLRDLSMNKAGVIGQRGGLLGDAERAILNKYGLMGQGFDQRQSALTGKGGAYTGAVNALTGAGQGMLGAGNLALGSGDTYSNLARNSLGGMAGLLDLEKTGAANYWQGIGTMADLASGMERNRYGAKTDPVVQNNPGPLDYVLEAAPLIIPFL